MRQTRIDHLLEDAVAKALGVKLPRRPVAARLARKAARPHTAVRQAA